MTRLNPDELASLAPTDVGTYLEASGWREAERYERATIWVRETSQGEAEVRLPSSNEFRDYPRRLAELLSTLSTVEQRDRESILRDLSLPRLDVQQIRTMPETPSGTTPLHQGFQAVKGVHDLFLAAATSASLEEPHAVLPSQKPKEAWDFLGGVRLGQTAPGSYILRVETPLTTVDPLGMPASRTVLKHLHQAVRCAHTAASESLEEGPRAFQQQVAQGSSANLCEALADIGARGNSAFEVGFDWARDLPVQEPTPPVRFGTELAGALKQGGQYLRGLPAFSQATVEGHIVELRSHRPAAQGAIEVEGVLKTPEGRRNDRVVVRLSSQQYDLALQSHGASHRIRVTGSVRLSGRQTEMRDVTGVERLEDG